MTAPRLLHARFPRLEDLPVLPLASLPTPVRRLEHASTQTGRSLWVKDDAATSDRYGGSKVRKLEWLLGHAREDRRDTLVVPGAFGSHLVVAAGVHALPAGFAVHGVLIPQPATPYVTRQLAAMASVGVSEHRARHPVGAAARVAQVALALKRASRRALVLPPGGSTPLGNVGLVEAGLEVAQQVDAGILPEPRALVCAAGTGGLAVGLAIGLAAAGLSTRVLAVRVGAPAALLRPMLWRAVQRTVGHLRDLERRFPDVADLAMQKITVDAGFVGAGYGHSGPSLDQTINDAAHDDLDLEVTYTAKAFASLLDAAQREGEGPLLFWRSSPTPAQVLALSSGTSFNSRATSTS